MEEVAVCLSFVSGVVGAYMLVIGVLVFIGKRQESFSEELSDAFDDARGVERSEHELASGERSMNPGVLNLLQWAAPLGLFYIILPPVLGRQDLAQLEGAYWFAVGGTIFSAVTKVVWSGVIHGIQIWEKENNIRN